VQREAEKIIAKDLMKICQMKLPVKQPCK